MGRSGPLRAAAMLLIIALPVVLAGCVGGQESAKTDKNHFRYTLQGGGSGIDKSWPWQTDGGTIKVEFAVQGGAGNAQVTVKGPSGNTVYSKSVSGGGQNTDSKTLNNMPSGTWTVALEADGIGGQLVLDLKRDSTGGYMPSWP